MSLIPQKTSRVRIGLTREGWIFLTILLFVSMGAVLRNINLLIMLSGMMIAPLMLGWRLCVGMLSGLNLTRNFSPWVHAGQRFDVEWQCENEKQRLPAWCLSITDHLKTNENDSLRSAQAINTLIAQVNPGQTEYATYRCLFPQRGSYWIGPAQVSTRFPMGLVKGSFKIGPGTEYFVAPMLGTLTPTWDRRLQSDATGSLAERRRRGIEEDEFYALRPWRSGDSRRQIHWRSTAKHGEPIIKQFDQKSDRDFALAIDLYAPTLDPESDSIPDTGEHARVEKALSFSATVLSQLQQAIQGKVAIALCAHEPSFLSEQNNRELVSIIMRRLATAQGAADSTLGDGIQQLFANVSQGTPVIVISTRPRPADFRDLVQSNTPSAMRMIEKWVRWIEVDSAEFHELFVMPDQTPPTINAPTPTAETAHAAH